MAPHQCWHQMSLVLKLNVGYIPSTEHPTAGQHSRAQTVRASLWPVTLLSVLQSFGETSSQRGNRVEVALDRCVLREGLDHRELLF